MDYRSGRDALTFQSGGGCMMLFGLPFLSMGLVAVTAGVLGVMAGETAAVVEIVVGVVFCLVGGGFVFGRAVSTFDPASGQWRTWVGALGIGKARQGSLEDLSEVVVTREVRRSKNSSYTVFPVKVYGKANLRLDIEAPREFEKARAVAERISKGLRLPLADHTGPQRQVTQPENLDDNLKRKLRDGRIRLEDIPEPAPKKSVYTVDGTTVRFVIPAGGWPEIVGGIAAMLLVPGMVWFGFLQDVVTDEGFSGSWNTAVVAIVAALFVVLPVLGGLGVIMHALTARHIVEVSPEGIRLERQFWLLATTKTMPADEIEDVTVRMLDTGGAGAITVVRRA